MYNSGMRNIECTKLRIEHINFKTSTNFDHWIRKGKGFNGGKDRRFYLPPCLLAKIKEFIGSRRRGLIFKSREGGSLTTSRVRQIVKEAG